MQEVFDLQIVNHQKLVGMRLPMSCLLFAVMATAN